MTNQEFSDGFSTLLNSYNTQALFGEQASLAEITLDEYEKSVFLTQAQDMIVKQYFDVRTDEVQEGHDGSEIRQMDFSSLITNSKGSHVKPTIKELKDSEGNNIGTISIVKASNCPVNKGKIVLNITAPNALIQADYVTHFRDLDDETKEIVVLMNQDWFDDNNTSVNDYLQAILALPVDTTTLPSSHISDYINLNVTDSHGDLYPSTLNLTMELPVEISTSIEEFNTNGCLFKLPTDILVILNERLVVTNGNKRKEYVVVPLNYREYDRMQSKPYSLPLKKQCWRLFNNIKGFDTLSEVIPIWDVIKDTSDVEYKLRYIRRPQPIVLVNLPDDLEIDGVNVETPCELNKILHMDILNKAFELATATRGGTPGATLERRRRNNTSDNED